ncbi:P-type ATPase [Borealophlyctis nickersoniae]|nr:P-type ATPase [Borealophlyctis nickersoniae]
MASNGGPSDSNLNIDARSMSVRLDGRASIEHQIDIHVLDLVDAVNNKDISLEDVLAGLKYVMDYRIKGGKMPHLEAELMARLLEGLLQNMGHHEGNLLRHRPTPEADMAFTLFGEFLEEVEEFRTAVGRKSASDLRHCLKIHRRCQRWSTPEEHENAAGVMALLIRYFPQFSDWKELVKEDEINDVEKLMEDYKDKFQQPAMPQAKELHPPPALYFDKNVEALAKMFGTDIKNGLTNSQVADFTDFYGQNKLPEPKKESALKMFWGQITDFMIIILILAAIAEIATGDVKAAIVLLVVVVINVIIGFTQEYKANKALEALLSLSVPQAKVIRDGKQEIVNSAVLVPGDIVVLEGDAVPADLRLCEVAQLEVIEIILTGESLPVSKNTHTIRERTRRLPLGDCKGNAFMTTTVARGRAKGIVVRTGEDTEIGRISSAITSQPNRQTPIQRKLDHLGKILVAIAVFLCILVVVIGVAYKHDPVEQVKVGISLAVSVIPEGLVAVVTVTMALGVVRMAQRHAIVRKLPSVETLGSVNVICSDKTGTLTEGKMGTQELWTSNNMLFTFTDSTSLDPQVGHARKCRHFPLDQALANPTNFHALHDAESREGAQDVPKTLEGVPEHLLAAGMIASLCNNAAIAYDEEIKGWKGIGDPTEVAMVVAAQKMGFAREWFHDTVRLKKLGEYAFDSDRKLMSVIYQQSEVDSKSTSFPPGTSFVLAKGAPEGLLQRCVSYLPQTPESSNFFSFLGGSPAVPLSDEFVEVVSQRSTQMASSGLRVLGLAMKFVTPQGAVDIINAKKETAAESELVFVGLIGLIDPAKAGVKESVAKCKRAGVRVIMITGDHIQTATAIAKQLGIIDPNKPSENRAMKGYEVDLLSEEALADLRPFPVVFARVSPDNKLKIVKALQSKKYSCAMTGDGVNDAPAIKQADVGVAMGISGTEITKQAADIVLADDNFSTIVEAVEEGRCVFDNIKKFVVYLLSCNSAEIFLFLICAIVNVELPFTIMQILYANIIADVPPAMSLGLEPREIGIMDRPPRPSGQGVLTLTSGTLVFAQGIILSMTAFTVYMISQRHGVGDVPTLRAQQSLTFAALTTMQLWQSFLSRSVAMSVVKTGLFGNRLLVCAFVFSMACLIIGIYVPGFNSWLELEPVNGLGWAIIVICVVVQTALIELAKLPIRKIEQKGGFKKWWKSRNQHPEHYVMHVGSA